MNIWVVVGALLVVVLMWAYFTAQRINRLHIRTDAARHALQAALDRRAAVVAVLAPESEAPGLAESLTLTRGNFEARAEAERKVSAVVKQLGTENPRIVDATTRVELALRFYNEAVSDSRALQSLRLVRLLRLSGNAPLPQYFEFSLH